MIGGWIWTVPRGWAGVHGGGGNGAYGVPSPRVCRRAPCANSAVLDGRCMGQWVANQYAWTTRVKRGLWHTSPFPLQSKCGVTPGPNLYTKTPLGHWNHPLRPAPGVLPWQNPMHRCAAQYLCPDFPGTFFLGVLNVSSASIVQASFFLCSLLRSNLSTCSILCNGPERSVFIGT